MSVSSWWTKTPRGWVTKSKRCVSCGALIEHTEPNDNAANHHCSPVHEAAKQAANTRLDEPIERNRTFAERMDEGWKMVSDDFDGRFGGEGNSDK